MANCVCFMIKLNVSKQRKTGEGKINWNCVKEIIILETSLKTVMYTLYHDAQSATSNKCDITKNFFLSKRHNNVIK